MTDAVVEYHLRDWGRQFRRKMLGGYRYIGQRGEAWFIDGWAEISPTHFRERMGGPATARDVRYPESFMGSGLVVHRAMYTMNEVRRTIIVVSYGVKDIDGRTFPAAERAAVVKLTVREFWKELSATKDAVSNWISADTAEIA